VKIVTKKSAYNDHLLFRKVPASKLGLTTVTFLLLLLRPGAGIAIIWAGHAMQKQK
jgi:hypothetical protein